MTESILPIEMAEYLPVFKDAVKCCCRYQHVYIVYILILVKTVRF